MATNAYGTTLKFTPQGGSQVIVGKLTSIGELSPDSEVVDVTTLDSAGGWRESMQGCKDAGQLEISGFHVKNEAGQTALRAAYESGLPGAVQICFTDGCTVGFSAFGKRHTLGSAEVDGAIGFGAVLRVTGAVTVTQPAAGQA